MKNLTIREGRKTDLSDALVLIKELAAYEKAPHEVTATEQSMIEDSEMYQFLVAEIDNHIVGIALFFPYYSTWKGRCIYLDDIIVTEYMRGKGIGKLLFNEVVERSKQFGAKRLMWQVLDWNEPAINFYKKLNSNLDEEWINCKLTEEQITNYSPKN